MKSRQSGGFSLIDTLVAFLILTFSASVIFAKLQTFSHFQQRLADRFFNNQSVLEQVLIYQTASRWEILEAEGQDIRLQASHQSGAQTTVSVRSHSGLGHLQIGYQLFTFEDPDSPAGTKKGLPLVFRQINLVPDQHTTKG